MNFGNVTVGSSTTRALTFTNLNKSSITISNANISGPGFNATGIAAGTILNSGQSAIVNVTFTPAAAGSVLGNVIVSINANNSRVTIALSGTGVSLGADALVTSITLTPANPTIAVGAQLQFRATDNMGNDVTSSVAWSTSDNSKATITASGLATAIADGDVTITATE